MQRCCASVWGALLLACNCFKLRWRLRFMMHYFHHIFTLFSYSNLLHLPHQFCDYGSSLHTCYTQYLVIFTSGIAGCEQQHGISNFSCYRRHGRKSWFHYSRWSRSLVRCAHVHFFLEIAASIIRKQQSCGESSRGTKNWNARLQHCSTNKTPEHDSSALLQAKVGQSWHASVPEDVPTLTRLVNDFERFGCGLKDGRILRRYPKDWKSKSKEVCIIQDQGTAPRSYLEPQRKQGYFRGSDYGGMASERVE